MKPTIPHTVTLAACLLLSALGLPAPAQSTAPNTAATETPMQAPRPMSARERSEQFQYNSVDREYKLRYAQSAQDENETLTAIRNMVEPQTKIFLVPNSGMIAVHAPEDVQMQVSRLLSALDQPRPKYRVTYTLTEFDGTRKIGVQHFSMVVTSGQHSILKQGSRVPIETVGKATEAPANQIVYIDVGMNFDTAATEMEGGATLRSKVEQTSIAPDSTPANNPDPVIRQTQFEGTTALLWNKPQLLGSLDVPSSTRHIDVEALLERVN